MTECVAKLIGNAKISLYFETYRILSGKNCKQFLKAAYIFFTDYCFNVVLLFNNGNYGNYRNTAEGNIQRDARLPELRRPFVHFTRINETVCNFANTDGQLAKRSARLSARTSLNSRDEWEKFTVSK